MSASHARSTQHRPGARAHHHIHLYERRAAAVGPVCLLVRDLLEDGLDQLARAAGRGGEEHDCSVVRLQEPVQRRGVRADVDRSGDGGAAECGGAGERCWRGQRTGSVGLGSDRLEEGRRKCGFGGGGRGLLERSRIGCRGKRRSCAWGWATEHSVYGWAQGGAEWCREEIGREV